MKKFFISALCLLTTYSFSMDLTGVYHLEGSNSPSGEINYRGQVTIVPQGENYRLDWTIGQQTQRGVGILSNNVLSVAYCNGSDLSMGVVSFSLTSDGCLVGKWAGLRGYSYGTELLTKTTH